MAQQPQDSAQEASRGDNAKRYGKLGLFVGAIAGLLTGGGIMGMVQMGLLAGGAAAMGGAVAGNKLNPLLDKVMDKIPGIGRKPAPAVDTPSAEVEMPMVVQTRARAEAPAQDVMPQVVQQNQRAVNSIDPAVLAQARQQTGSSMESAREGMDPNAAVVNASSLPSEWVGRQGVKAPTHQGPSISQ